MEFPLLTYLLIGLAILFGIGVLIAWGFTGFYLIKSLNRFQPGRRWGGLLFFGLFVPWLFTPEGNVYRLKCLRAGGLFLVLFALALGAGFGAVFISKQ